MPHTAEGAPAPGDLELLRDGGTRPWGNGSTRRTKCERGGGRAGRGAAGPRDQCADSAVPAGTSRVPSTRSSTAARRRVSACPSVCPSVRPSWHGPIPEQRTLMPCFLSHEQTIPELISGGYRLITAGKARNALSLLNDRRLGPALPGAQCPHQAVP